MKKIKYEFCMSEFKPALGALAVLFVIVVGWSTWNFTHLQRQGDPGVGLAAAVKPPAPSIRVKAKMTHPYWGNCNMCHITIDVPVKPISKVFSGPPISVTAPMPHEYWGNCNLCHKVSGGFQPQQAEPPQAQAAAATAPALPPPISPGVKPLHANWGPCENCHQIIGNKTPATAGTGQLAAFTSIDAATMGLKVQAVNAAQMRQLGLGNEDGALVLEVTPGSLAAQTGLQKGDEIIRIDKVKIETMTDFDTALAQIQPGSNLKINIYREKKTRNLFMQIPETFPENVNVAAFAPITQQAPQQPGQFAVDPPVGKVAVAVSGPQLNSKVSSHFGANQYFLIFDPERNTSQTVGNPNFNDATGRGVQTAQFLADLEIANVIAGSFSADAFDALKGLRIDPYSGVTGTASDVLAIYLDGQMRSTTVVPDVLPPPPVAAGSRS